MAAHRRVRQHRLFQAAQSVIAPFSTTGLTQVVSVVAVNSAGVTKVEWSQGYNGGTARTVGSPFPGPHAIPTAMINISKSNWVIVSEAGYGYTPLLRRDAFQNPLRSITRISTCRATRPTSPTTPAAERSRRRLRLGRAHGIGGPFPPAGIFP